MVDVMVPCHHHFTRILLDLEGLKAHNVQDPRLDPNHNLGFYNFFKNKFHPCWLILESPLEICCGLIQGWIGEMFMALEFWARGQCMWEVSAHFERKVFFFFFNMAHEMSVGASWCMTNLWPSNFYVHKHYLLDLQVVKCCTINKQEMLCH
jgi:hypothetical protein